MENFRGLRKVVMVDTREGNGTPENPSRIVHWIFDLDQHGGAFGGLVGKIDNYQDQAQSEKTNSFSGYMDELDPKYDFISMERARELWKRYQLSNRGNYRDFTHFVETNLNQSFNTPQ